MTKCEIERRIDILFYFILLIFFFFSLILKFQVRTYFHYTAEFVHHEGILIGPNFAIQTTEIDRLRTGCSELSFELYAQSKTVCKYDMTCVR